MPVSGSEMKLHELHFASSLEELNRKVDVENVKKNPAVSLASLEKVFQAADTAMRIDKDDELAYIMYMRYINCYKYLKKEDQNKVRSNATFALTQAEHLSNRLKKRYETAKECKVEEAKVQEKEFEDATQNMTRRKNIATESVVNGVDLPVIHDSAITHEQLKTLMDQRATKFLLIDTRSPADFSSSHPNHPDSICIPNVVLVTGISANILTQKLDTSSPESVDLWKRRGTFDLIVLYDWNSTFEQRDQTAPLSVLYNVITEWDPNTEYKGKIKILQGGYRQFHRTYPTYFLGKGPTTNGKVEEPSSLNQVSLASITYPSLEDAPAPPPSLPSPTLPPAKVYNAISQEDNKSKEYPTESHIPAVHAVPSRVVNRATKPTHLITPIEQAKKVVPTEPIPTPIIPEPAPPPAVPVPLPLPVEEAEESKPKPELNGFIRSPKKDVKTEKLKTDGETRGSNAMKRSQSNPNLAQMSLDEPPSFNRMQKPQTRRDFPTVSSTMRHHRTGLKNLGNSCYMSSIIQCLSHTRDLAIFLTSDTQKRFGAIGDVTKEVGMTIQQLNRGSRSFAPEELKRVIGKHNSAFCGYTQHDSHELLTFLLDWMHEELNQAVRRRSKLKEQKNENVPIEIAYDAFRTDYLTVNNSIISQLFAGDQTSTIKCLKCQKSSVTFEPFYFLSVPIPPGTSAKFTLTECLELYTTVERLDIVCSHCKAPPGETVKFIQLWRMPRYLLIHLQRFYNNGERNGNYRKKINEVAFPLDHLDMTSHVKGPTTLTSNHYELFAVSNHYGSMENGHYTAFCRNPESWTKFDDADASLISDREVCTTAAYILFYQARDDD